LLSIGNNNSYGDAAVPQSSIFKSTKFNNSSFLDINLTVNEYLDNYKKIPFGTPGKSNVTLAGAIASDVHGKDGYWGGSFQKNIDELAILISSNEIIYCSRTKEPEIFWSSIGGYGLTGEIVGVKFKKDLPNKHNYFEVHIKKGYKLENLFKSFKQEQGFYNVGWIDLLSKSCKWVLESAKPIQNKEEFPSQIKNQSVEFKNSAPFIGLNKFKLMNLINFVYFFNKRNGSILKKPLNNVMFPLNMFTDTRNLSKNRKIIQIQFSISTKYENEIENLIRKLIYKQNPLLCSIKKLSSNESNLNLSFVQEGWTIAVDFPYENFNFDEVRYFYKELIKYNGKVYLAKDSTLTEKEFKQMYQNYDNWKIIVKEIDPNNIFQSEMSHRLGLKDW